MDIRVTRDEMIPYIKKVWAGIQDEISAARKKLQGRFNERNVYTLASQKFCNPSYFPEKWADEYLLIIAKKSQQPSSIRKIITLVGNRASMMCAIDKQNKLEKEQRKPKVKKDQQ